MTKLRCNARAIEARADSLQRAAKWVREVADTLTACEKSIKGNPSLAGAGYDNKLAVGIFRLGTYADGLDECATTTHAAAQAYRGAEVRIIAALDGRDPQDVTD